MPKKAKIITDFREYPESELSDSVSRILNYLKSGHDVFSALPVPLDLLKKQLKKINKVRNAMLYAGQSADTKKARRIVQRSLSSIGRYINDLANGNVSILNRSGFPLHKPCKAQGILPKTVLKLTAIRGSGRLKFEISIIRIQNVRYGIMYTLADNPEKDPSKWRFHYCSKKDGIMPNLESNREYKFVSFGMGSDRRLTYSNPVFLLPG